MFTDIFSEVGKYEEALIIVDRIPNKQKNYLSNLETGRAIVFEQGFSKKAIQVQISMKINIGDNKIITDHDIRENDLSVFLQNIDYPKS